MAWFSKPPIFALEVKFGGRKTRFRAVAIIQTEGNNVFDQITALDTVCSRKVVDHI
jgi:hypothetical protein